MSYFICPVEKGLRKKWIHAIRRDEGKDFQIKPTTKVCSRHFRENDIKKTLAGKFQLRPGAVPSLFSWTRTSPRERKASTYRECREASTALFEASEIAEPEGQSNSEILEDKVVASEYDNSNDVAACAETQTNESKAVEMEPREFMENMDNSQELISLKEELSKLTSQLENMKRQNELLQSQLSNIERFRNNDSAINFYTGFPNWNTFMAVFFFWIGVIQVKSLDIGCPRMYMYQPIFMRRLVSLKVKGEGLEPYGQLMNVFWYCADLDKAFERNILPTFSRFQRRR